MPPVLLHPGTLDGEDAHGTGDGQHELQPLGAADAVDVGSSAVLVTATADDGWQAWASSAMVSALDRRVEGADGVARYGMIVVDEPVPADAHGGALVDAGGAVVGIASPVPAEGTSGTATPVDLVLHVAHQLIEHGHVDHVWLGLHDVDLDAAAWEAGAGALVEEVAAGGPAEAAGIVPGDVVVDVGGDRTPSMAAIIAALRLHRPGDVVELRVWRDGAEHQVEVVLAAKDR